MCRLCARFNASSSLFPKRPLHRRHVYAAATGPPCRCLLGTSLGMACLLGPPNVHAEARNRAEAPTQPSWSPGVSAWPPLISGVCSPPVLYRPPFAVPGTWCSRRAKGAKSNIMTRLKTTSSTSAAPKRLLPSCALAACSGQDAHAKNLLPCHGTSPLEHQQLAIATHAPAVLTHVRGTRTALACMHARLAECAPCHGCMVTALAPRGPLRAMHALQLRPQPAAAS